MGDVTPSSATGLNPGTALVTNGWHGEDPYAGVRAKDGADAVALHPDRTLFLSWPPFQQDVGTRILMAYKGKRVIYIGEDKGHPGDDELRRYSMRIGPESIPASRCTGGVSTIG